MHRFKTALPVWLVLAGIWIRPGIVRGQSSALLEGAIVSPIPPVPSGASLVQRARCDICPPVHEKYEAEFNSLHNELGHGRRHKGKSPSPNAMGG
jgi:hypothetical protein